MALIPFPNNAPAPLPDDDLNEDRDQDGLLDADGDGKMSFLDHLDELRRRIIYAVIAVFVGFVIAFFFINQIFEFVMAPMQRLLPAGGTLVYTDPTEAFMLYIKIALIAGLLIASPAVFAQIWLFVAPGLYAHEKRLVLPLIVSSTLLFFVGMAFCYFFVFGAVFDFIHQWAPKSISVAPDIEAYFNFALGMFLAFGIAFEIPVVVVVLAITGIVSIDQLREWREVDER